MIWDEKRQNKELLSFIKELSSLYNQYPQFRSSEFHFLDYTDDILIYEKEDLIFLINKGDRSDTIDLSNEYINIQTKETYTEKLKLKKKSFLILKKSG